MLYTVLLLCLTSAVVRVDGIWSCGGVNTNGSDPLTECEKSAMLFRVNEARRIFHATFDAVNPWLDETKYQDSVAWDESMESYLDTVTYCSQVNGYGCMDLYCPSRHNPVNDWSQLYADPSGFVDVDYDQGTARCGTLSVGSGNCLDFMQLVDENLTQMACKNTAMGDPYMNFVCIFSPVTTWNEETYAAPFQTSASSSGDDGDTSSTSSSSSNPGIWVGVALALVALVAVVVVGVYLDQQRRATNDSEPAVPERKTSAKEIATAQGA